MGDSPEFSQPESAQPADRSTAATPDAVMGRGDGHDTTASDAESEVVVLERLEAELAQIDQDLQELDQQSR